MSSVCIVMGSKSLNALTNYEFLAFLCFFLFVEKQRSVFLSPFLCSYKEMEYSALRTSPSYTASKSPEVNADNP